MPGITGIISRSPGKERALDQMIASMVHEPFYISGKYVINKLGLFAGWTCHKGSFSDCMPIYNEKKDLVLFFGGEDFVAKEVIDNLKVGGHEFDSFNASYLIHLYEEKGNNFLLDLNGFFHGLLVDLRERKIILFNDRFGMQRIYYHESKDEFLFSSEAKSLLKVLPKLREIDLNSLGEFFSCGCVLNNKTLLPNIFLLPGGSAWTFCNGSPVEKDQYFKPEVWENQPILDNKTFYNRVRETFRNILPRYFRSSGKLGFSLTAGLDTRMILANMDIPAGAMPCYTFGGPYRDSFDVKIARKIAEACKQAHHTLRLDSNFLTQFPALAEQAVYITDGGLDVSGAANLYVNKLAKGIAPIRLTGNYGQEVLRRYTAFRPNPPVRELFSPEFQKYIENSKNTYREVTGGHKLSFALFKQAPWYQNPRLCLEQSQLVQRSPYMDNDFVKLVYQAPVEILKSNDLTLQIIKDGNARLAGIATDRGMMGEMGFPFSKMKRAYLEFLIKMDYYYSHGMNQRMASLDHAIGWLQLERIFLGRNKYYHLRPWFRDEWSSYLKDVLLSERAMGRSYLNKNFLSEMVNRHIKGDRNFADFINLILTVELTHRILIEAG